VPIKINETKVCFDFHIYAIIEFHILIGHPLENLIQEKPSRRGLDEKLGTIASATHLEIPMAEHLPNHNLFEEAKFISPFISPKLACETECIPSPLLESKSCPSGHPNVVLDSDRESTLILCDRFCAMDMPKAPTLETKKNSANEHGNFSFKIPHISCSFSESPKFDLLSTSCTHENHNLLFLLVHKLFKKAVVDAYIYHKYYRSRGYIVVLTLQLQR
jgi:hypothetical protein